MTTCSLSDKTSHVVKSEFVEIRRLDIAHHVTNGLSQPPCTTVCTGESETPLAPDPQRLNPNTQLLTQ